MSGEIKYKPIYGLQKPFDDGPEDAEAYGFSSVGGEYCFYKFNKSSVYCFDTDNQWSHIDGAPNVPFLAMRRIIKTPVWTFADQKAGRLPNIGDKHRFDGLAGDFICRFIDSDGDIWSSGDDSQMYSSGDYEAIPIETQEERAQRLEDEFFLAVKQEWQHPKTPSGPSAHFELGVRAAYRRLSGELQAPTKMD